MASSFGICTLPQIMIPSAQMQVLVLAMSPTLYLIGEAGLVQPPLLKQAPGCKASCKNLPWCAPASFLQPAGAHI